MEEDTNRTRHGNIHRTKKVAAFLVVFAMAALLASCAQETGGTTGSSAAAPSGTTAMGTTSGTTMSGTTMGGTTMGTTMGGTTMGGGTTGGTTMSGTTSGGTTMGGGTTGGTTAGTTSGGTLTSVRSIVSETNKSSLVGRRVELGNVKVRSSIGNTGFLVGSSGADQVLVVPGSAANVQKGQTATIKGTLKKVPGISQAQQQFGVSAAVADLLQSQVVYLDANQVQ